MRILLIKPYNISDHIQPSLGLGYLATAVRNNHEVLLMDCIKEGIKPEKISDRIKKLKPDLVGIQCYTFDLNAVKQILSEIKSLGKGIITVIGGPHSSTAPLESFEYFGDLLDFAFVGEAEKGFPLLIDSLEKGKAADLTTIPGLVWKNNGQYVVNERHYEDNLDSLGMPSWDLIRPETYPESQHGAYFEKFPIAPIMLTRGCPYRCEFCAGNLVSGRKVRKRTIQHVMDEIKFLHDKHGIREFHVIDDNFTIDKNYAKEFLRNLLKLNLDISWSTPNGVRMESLDDEMLELMKKTGLYMISFGIESGSNRILDLMKKETTVNKIREKVGLARKHKIPVAGFFILGYPGETRRDILKTIAFAKNLPIQRANFFTYLPFPGTASYRKLLDAGEINKVDMERFLFMNAAYVPKGMSRKELKNLQRLAFMKFYFRPKIIISHVTGVKSFRHFLFLAKRFYHWVIMSR